MNLTRQRNENIRICINHKMLTTEDFKYLVDWLYECVKESYEADKTVKELAEGSYKPLKGVISSLWKMIDKAIFEGRTRMLRYGDGYVYIYTGKWFEKVEDSAFMEELVRRVLARLNVQPVYQLEGAKKIAAPLLNRLKLSAECAYEPNRRWICFQNGVLDLKNKVFKDKFSIDCCTDIILDFDYNPRANGLLWSIKLKQIIPSNGFQNDFQQFCGSLLADRNMYRNEYICYLYGSGGNGKSVLSGAIASMLGTKHCSTFSLNQIFAKETATLFVIKELKGKLLNVSDDVSAQQISGGAFKSFVSGEPIQGRSVGKGDWSIVTPPMLLGCLNEFPGSVDDDSEGNHRRQLIIETTNKEWIGEERDTQLPAKLATTESKQAIFNWMYEGYKKFVSNKGEIILSKDAKLARQHRKEDSSPMRRWAKERFFTKAVPVDNRDPRWHKLTDLYADYRTFCFNNGYKLEADARKITAMLRSMGIEVKNLLGRGTAACVGVFDVDTNDKGQLISGE